MKLLAKNVEQLQSIIKPGYDSTQLTPGIVHIGLGNFHRAHQAWYLHRLMEMGLAHDWAIIGAGVRAHDEDMRNKLKAQEYRTHLIELDSQGVSTEVIGSMIGFVPVEEHNGALIAQMTDPCIRIVSLTVTEGGYYINPAIQGFDTKHQDILHDVKYPDKPRTAFGAMIAALKIRRNRNLDAFTCQSCDNLRRNGDVLRQTILSLARMIDTDLADWIDKNASFPNSMIDGIVPTTGPKELALAKNLGIEDAAPVTHENFRQWVMEDKFCAGRPPWDKAGATFSNLVHDYETMKMRILNGGHQILANAGELLSLKTISECMNDPIVTCFFRKILHGEVAPTVSPVPDITPEAYVDIIELRFSNSAIFDTTRRVAFDGSARHPVFLLPILRDALARDGKFEGLCLAEALWARMCAGNREDGSIIKPNDPLWDDLSACANIARENPFAWIKQRHIYSDLIEQKRFVDCFEKWLKHIWEQGVESAILTYCSET